jgi:molybdenum cofactor cytidylyltransferase
MVRTFAIVPAAGRSERMGAHKLLLPFHGRPLVERVLAAWSASCVTHTVVVVRPDDEKLAACCEPFRVEVLAPSRPPADMKESVQLATEHIARHCAPADDDAWLVAPADMPGLSWPIIDRVVSEYNATRPLAVAPTFDGRRGHPVAMPWSYVGEMATLGAGEGINALVARIAVRELTWATSEILTDVDTMADYARLTAHVHTKQVAPQRGSRNDRIQNVSPITQAIA